MKHTFIFLLGAFFLACGQPPQQKAEPKAAGSSPNPENFDWLLGKWKRLNENARKETFEHWQKIRAVEYAGIGFSMQDGDTIAQEILRLRKADGQWDLIVTLSAGQEPVTFRVTRYGEHTFTCENPENDFPQKITYWEAEGKLRASVSNPEMEIPFVFGPLTE